MITNIDRVELKLQKFTLEQVTSGYDYQTYSHADFTRETVHRLVGTFIQKLQHSELIVWEVSYPSSWWQHFKRDVLPKWFVKRYPVTLKIEHHEYIADLSLVKVADYQTLQACGPNPIYVQLRQRPVTARDYETSVASASREHYGEGPVNIDGVMGTTVPVRKHKLSTKAKPRTKT